MTYCGSQVVNIIFPMLAAFNTNDIKNSDGSKYKALNQPLLNQNAKHAFDPLAIPELKHDMAPLSDQFVYMMQLLNHFSKKLENKEALPDTSKVEVVPITW